MQRGKCRPPTCGLVVSRVMMPIAASGSLWSCLGSSDPLELGKKKSDFFQSASDLRAIIGCDSAARAGALLPSLPKRCYCDQPNGPREGSATSNRHLIAPAAGGGRSQRRGFPGSVPSINSLLQVGGITMCSRKSHSGPCTSPGFQSCPCQRGICW